jgi:hypothetical protein
VAHRTARLTVFGRQLLIARVESGWPVAHVAEQLGISRATAYKWVQRHRAEGPVGLEDRSSRPKRSPRRLSAAIEAEILAARSTWRYGPDRLGPLLGRPPSTVHRVLTRRGLSRLRDADRVTTAPVRYVACHPGALVHQDHKKQGRIPDGGGWRALGRDGTRDHQRAGVGYEHLEVLIDDASRLCSGPSSSGPSPTRSSACGQAGASSATTCRSDGATPISPTSRPNRCTFTSASSTGWRSGTPSASSKGRTWGFAASAMSRSPRVRRSRAARSKT